MALLRLFIEVLIGSRSLRSRFFRKKNPKQDSHLFRFVSLLRYRCFTTYVGGVVTDTPTY